MPDDNRPMTAAQGERIIELLEQIARQGGGHTPSIQDEINMVRLQGGDLYEHFKAKEKAMPRRKSHRRATTTGA